MNKVRLFATVMLLSMIPSAPAFAGWKLVASQKPATVAKGTLTVTPGEVWNRSSGRPIKKGEVWTLDGTGLNELYFVSGLVAGETLFKDINKKERPLPLLSASLQLNEIPEFFESSNRIAMNTSVFQVSGVEPATLGGKAGVRFSFTYAVEGSTLTRKGLATATVDAGKLYLISFVAPSTYFFDRDRAKAEAIMASAKF